MDQETLTRLAAPVPRYTSYPTAPHFSADVTASTYRGWLTALPAGERISLYVHIPFCTQLCWYCGCTTKITQRHEPVRRYLSTLEHEIEEVGKLLPEGTTIAHIHFGGGSPSILDPDDIAHLNDILREHFTFADDVEFAIEVDPRDLNTERIAAFAAAGVNRVSLGVQDFSEKVQAAINRQQSYALTRDVLEEFRTHGVGSVNIDLVYGLPYQTVDSIRDTIAKVITLRPERIALFGYAHLPSRITHQRLIPEDHLPGTQERYEQAELAAQALLDSGYVRVGLDHYALPDDSLASGEIRRNFQGYTSDDANILVGLGASSIGRLPQGYVQNTPAIAEYERRVKECGLATARGHAMSDDDQIRSLVIERLMCDLRFPADELEQRFGNAAQPVLQQAVALSASDMADLVECPVDGGAAFTVAERGRPFVRSICARFDAYLGQSQAQHSAGV